MARNAALSFGGHLLPLAAAFVAIPVTARALGPVRFGLLGLAWALLEYLGFVELGLARTSVRFVAQSLARSAAEVRQTVVVSITTQLGLALVAAAALAAAAVPLANEVFSIPQESRAEAIRLFYAVAANVVVVILVSALRGVLEGAQRFGASTAVKIPTATAAVVIPALASVAGASLAAIMWMVLLVRVTAALWLIAVLPRLVAGFAWELPRRWTHLRGLFAYSGWVAVSGVINPVLASFDRFALASFAGVAAVGLYAAPYEAAVRLLLVPTSMFAALFPALSATYVGSNSDRHANRLLEASLRQLAMVLTPVVIVLFAFSPELLSAWLRRAFSPEMTAAFRILLIGVLANGLAHIPAVFLYAVGRPDLSAKIHLAEVVLHIPLTIALVTSYGVTGAALAWAIRIVLDALLLSFFAVRLGAGREIVPAFPQWLALAIAVAALTAAVVAAKLVLPTSVPLAVSAAALGIVVFAAVAWTKALGPGERRTWIQFGRRA